jgi:hypothetical protein
VQDVRMSNSKSPVSNNLPLSEPHQPACRLVAAAVPARDEEMRSIQRPFRSIGRPDALTAQRIEVGIVLHAMLGEAAACEYFAKHDIDSDLVQRVLSPEGRRRGNHDANGVRT